MNNRIVAVGSLETKSAIWVDWHATQDLQTWEWVQREMKAAYGEDALERIVLVETDGVEPIVLSPEQTQKLMSGVCAMSTHSWNKTRKSRWRCHVCNKVRKVRKRRRRKQHDKPAV